jgi:tetratricopeptide (TPR) repeat protein
MFVTLGLLAAGGASAPTQGVVARRSLAELAEKYRGADRDDAVATVARWMQREVEGGTQDLLEAVEASTHAEHATPEDVARGEATLATATALLSDAAWRALYLADAPRARWQLHPASRLVQAAPSAGRLPELAARFYLVAGLMLHETADLAGAWDMLSEGRRQAEDDAELLLAQGSLSETIATLRVYDVPGQRRGPSRSRDEPQFAIEGEEGAVAPLPHTDLADAQALYTRALERDPGLLEARLRLGRVLLHRDRPREALAQLEHVLKDSSRPAQLFMARLFEGRCRERLGDLRGAEVAFSAAVDLDPRARSGLVAWGRALERVGEDRRAQEAFERALRPASEGQPDPWLDYVRGQPDRIESALEKLRGLVR